MLWCIIMYIHSVGRNVFPFWPLTVLDEIKYFIETITKFTSPPKKQNATQRTYAWRNLHKFLISSISTHFVCVTRWQRQENHIKIVKINIISIWTIRKFINLRAGPCVINYLYVLWWYERKKYVLCMFATRVCVHVLAKEPSSICVLKFTCLTCLIIKVDRNLHLTNSGPVRCCCFFVRSDDMYWPNEWNCWWTIVLQLKNANFHLNYQVFNRLQSSFD